METNYISISNFQVEAKIYYTDLNFSVKQDQYKYGSKIFWEKKYRIFRLNKRPIKRQLIYELTVLLRKKYLKNSLEVENNF